MDQDGRDEAAVRKRTSTACEACRASKLRCLPSEQPGVCKKCHESKKECVSRTGPRIRRSKKAILAQSLAQPAATASAAPPSTFTIDFDVPSQPEVNDSHRQLEESHRFVLDTLFPESDDALLGLPAPMAALPSPAASSPAPSPAVPMNGYYAKPQFNRASAESLLATFRSSMLTHFPCVVVSPEETVGNLAAARPFVLLAILAAASGSKTLQGHALYDEEFRKVLGLKFVAGGERSLELLQGVLIYCAWYPFHLRPKNKQIAHYLRMAGDLVHDLELDQEPAAGNFAELPMNGDVDSIRAYLGYQCLLAVAFLSLNDRTGLVSSGSSWAIACCDVLDTISEQPSDVVLTTLVRLSSTTGAAWEAVNDRKGQSELQSRLALLGIETQIRAIKDSIPPHVESLTPIRISIMTAELYLSGGASLFKFPRRSKRGDTSLQPDHAKLFPCCQHVREFLGFIQNLDKQSFACFTCMDWCKFIMAIIAAIRLSFPLAECPQWDSSWARGNLELGAFLDRMCAEPETATAAPVDVLAATRVVLRSVKQKYEFNLAKVVAAENLDASIGLAGGCPMLDGSLSQYIPVWDPEIMTNPMSMGTSEKTPGSQPIFHDLWATMTMSWAE